MLKSSFISGVQIWLGPYMKIWQISASARYDIQYNPKHNIFINKKLDKLQIL